MAKPALEELFLGSFCYLIPLGVTVDSEVVAWDGKPDITPTSNWTDYNIGSVLGFVPGVVTEDRSFKRASPFGGWEIVPKKVVMQDYIDLKTREMGELLLRLQFGLKDEIALGTAQTMFGSSVRSIQAWLKFHMRKEDGSELCIGDMLATVELNKGLVADGKVSEPEFRCTQIKSWNNQLVEGNTIVFPAAA